MKTFRHSVLAGILMLSAAAAVKAQAPAAPVPVGRASVASIAAVNALMAELGLSSMSFNEMIETRLPMPLEKGSVATDQPLGVVLMAGDKLPSDMSSAIGSMVIAVPIVKGKLSEADLKKNAGAEAVKNQPGVLATTTMSLRRTEKYLLGQFGKPAGIGAVAADPFAADYKDKGNLSVISLNVATLRKVLGPTLQQMAAQAQPTAVPPTATSPAMAYAGLVTMAAGPAMNFLNSTDKLTIALAQDAQNVHLRTWVSPFALGGGGTPPTMQRPVFPNGVFATLNIIYPNAETASSAQNFLASLPAPALRMPAVSGYDAKSDQALKDFVKLFASGDAFSVGLAQDRRGLMGYLAVQKHAPIDYTHELDSLNKEVDAIDALIGSKDASEITTYEAGSKKVTRLTIKDGEGKISGAIDCIQDGKTLYVTFAPNDGHYVSDFAAGGLKDTSNLGVAGSLNLEEYTKLLATVGSLANMPAEAKEKLLQGFTGQTVTWSAQVVPDQKSLLMQLHVPKAALKTVAQMLEMATPGTPPPQGMIPAQPAH